MTVIQKAKANPMIATLIIFGTLGTAIVGVTKGVSQVDSLIVTEAELLIYDLKAHTFASQQFSDIDKKLEEIAVVGKCRWLKLQIRSLEDAIYVRKRDGADPDYINDLEGDLDELEDGYRALLCARKLA